MVAVTTMALMLCAGDLLAQRSGGRGGGHGGGRTGGAPSGPVDTNEEKEFKRLIAVQATESQSQQFQVLAKSTEAARNQAHDLREQSDNGVAGLKTQTAALKDAVDSACTQNNYFLRSFSKPQVSGLKEFTKKLAKAESDVVRERNALDHDSAAASLDGKRAAATAERLEKALTTLQVQQLSLADEMGIARSSP